MFHDCAIHILFANHKLYSRILSSIIKNNLKMLRKNYKFLLKTVKPFNFAYFNFVFLQNINDFTPLYVSFSKKSDDFTYFTFYSGGKSRKKLYMSFYILFR